MPKANNQLLKKFLSLAISWVKVVKNYPKLSKKNFIEEINLGAHFLLLTFFENFHFKPLYILKWRLIFDDFYSTDHKTSKLFKGLVVGFGPKGMPGRMCDGVC